MQTRRTDGKREARRQGGRERGGREENMKNIPKKIKYNQLIKQVAVFCILISSGKQLLFDIDSENDLSHSLNLSFFNSRMEFLVPGLQTFW